MQCNVGNYNPKVISGTSRLFIGLNSIETSLGHAVIQFATLALAWKVGTQKQHCATQKQY